MLALVKKANLLDGYLENQVFSPAVTRGKDIVWARGAALAGPPYLARAAEEHSGPHMPWFWEGTLQGGGVLNDMMCHSVEEARFMLTPPGAPRDVLTPVSVTAYTNCLKWQEPKYAARSGQEQRRQDRLPQAPVRGLRPLAGRVPRPPRARSWSSRRPPPGATSGPACG